ncbi:hypothetical protein [Oxalicibacterium faecigallinarum]|uniref:DUF3892 domain-containing protein n=2 Tax=Oxalicibacterium faecigallinarum TaxID=573741 RepID=A0A8J3AX04_9BURK|nr:hypothetical protein [Oxalicibacterium faecigallinarum]GGI17808.1 hypothetical protein GCM10008066_10840 [Oxalicibacterium faecigallinarum]
MTSVHLIEAVRFNEAGDRVEMVRWGRGHRKGNGSPGWEAVMVEQDVNLVVDALHFGDEVATAFKVGGEIVLGPRVHVVIHQHGIEDIDTIDHDVPGRTLADLPRF